MKLFSSKSLRDCEEVVGEVVTVRQGSMKQWLMSLPEEKANALIGVVGLILAMLITPLSFRIAERIDAVEFTIGQPVAAVETVVKADTLAHVGAAGDPVEIAAVPVETKTAVNDALALAIGIDAVMSSIPDGEYASDVTLVMIGNTILNRVESSRYPGTVEEVLCQPYQFSCFGETGLKWVGVAAKNDTFKSRCISAAERVLGGERILSRDVVYVSGSKVGSVEAQLDGLFFCK